MHVGEARVAIKTCPSDQENSTSVGIWTAVAVGYCQKVQMNGFQMTVVYLNWRAFTGYYIDTQQHFITIAIVFNMLNRFRLNFMNAWNSSVCGFFEITTV